MCGAKSTQIKKVTASVFSSTVSSDCNESLPSSTAILEIEAILLNKIRDAKQRVKYRKLVRPRLKITPLAQLVELDAYMGTRF